MNAPAPIGAGGTMFYHYAHATHRGMVREQNEDAIAIAPASGLAIVADGMGGYNAGEVASRLAAEFLMTHLVQDLAQLRDAAVREAGAYPSNRMLHSLLRARVDGANEAIIDVARRERECEGMGTTLAVLLFSDDVATTLHLGDSRIYRMRDGVLSLLTRDHSLLQEQIDAGLLSLRDSRSSLNRNFVTRALGVDLVADPDIADHPLRPGDLYLMCSDGLPDMLSDEEIFNLLIGYFSNDDSAAARMESGPDRPADGRVAELAVLDEVAAKLIDAANALGGRDNVTVVLASVGWARFAGPDHETTADDAPDDRRQNDRRSA